MRHSVGQTLTHAGSRSFSTRFAQKLHFSAVLRVRIDEQLIVGARDHAGAAADARVAVQIDDAVAALEERVGRANLRARRFVALVAEDGKEEPARVGKGAFLDGLHPAAIHADRNLVLSLAGDGAGVTADAFSKIDGEPVVGHAGLRIYHACRTTEMNHRDTETRRSARVARPTGEPVGAGRKDRQKTQTSCHSMFAREVVDVVNLCSLCLCGSISCSSISRGERRSTPPAALQPGSAETSRECARTRPRSADRARRRARSVCANAAAIARRASEPRERGDFTRRGRRGLGGRDRQLLDRRRRHVRRHAQADEVVDDEAVEETAEKMLIARVAAACAGRRRCGSRRNRPGSTAAMSVRRLVALATSR